MCHLEYVAFDDDIVQNIQIGFTLKNYLYFFWFAMLAQYQKTGQGGYSNHPSKWVHLVRSIYSFLTHFTAPGEFLGGGGVSFTLCVGW